MTEVEPAPISDGAIDGGDGDVQALRRIVNRICAIHTRLGLWLEDNMAIHFADLHARVADASRSFQEGPPYHLVWLNPETGQEVTREVGSPGGLAAELADIIFNTLAIGQQAGLDMAGTLLDMQASYEFLVRNNTEWITIPDGDQDAPGTGDQAAVAAPSAKEPT